MPARSPLLVRYADVVREVLQIATLRYHTDLAASGLYSVGTLTRDFANLSLNIVDVIMFFMDLSIRCNFGICRICSPNQVGLERYTV